MNIALLSLIVTSFLSQQTTTGNKGIPDMAWRTHLKKEVFESGKEKLLYQIMTPENPAPGTKYPLVIFLHGAGERGLDNNAQLVHGVKDFAKPESRKSYPCFLIAPQCPNDKKWAEVDWSANSHQRPEKPSDPATLLLKLIDILPTQFPIDTSRIYITGLSMGGYGTWDLIARKPDLFAAAVPVCGGGDEKDASIIAKIPIWAFHGSKDTVVKPQRSTNMIEAIKKAGGNPKVTLYPEVGHNSWVNAYSDPEMLKWLFNQKK
ncbi:MAG: prolyl oligopeptidase family serine peptidase [Planctomycetota bacterium]